MVYVKRLHKVLGLLMLLPILGWVVTGVLFFIKPGYQAAFAPLTVKTYPLDAELRIQPANDWQELTLLHTVLGHHLLVKQQDKRLHLDAISLQPFTATLEQTTLLVNEAIAENPERYGRLAEWDGSQGLTSTGVVINLDWQQLILRQLGPDTQRINSWYKIHYLQWTPFKAVNDVLGIIGLGLLLLLSLCGGWLYWQRRQTVTDATKVVRH